MKSQIFSSKQGLLYIKERLNRFWISSLVMFLVYLFSGIVPLLLSREDLPEYYLRMSLNNTSPFYIMALFAFPISIGICMFKYLHNTSSVSIMHALPFKRSQLFRYNFIAGLILILIPIIVTCGLYLLLARPVILDDINIFSYGMIFKWLISSIFIAVFIYTVTVFAGICSANIVIHTLLSIFFIVLAPLFYGILNIYFDLYLKGYPGFENVPSTMAKLSPLSNSIVEGNNISGKIFIIYILIMLVLVVLSIFMYNKRQLEKATDSIAFKVVEPIIAMLTTFFGMSLMGLWFSSMSNSNDNKIMFANLGYIVGAIIFFFISYMIIKQTPKVFNKKNFKIFALYAIISVLFIGNMHLDVANYGKSHPDNSDITTASLVFTGANSLPAIPAINQYSLSKYDSYSNPYDTVMTFDDRKAINMITKLQEDTVSMDSDNVAFDTFFDLKFSYSTDGHKSSPFYHDVLKNQHRTVNTDVDNIIKNKSFRAFITSDALSRKIENAVSPEYNRGFDIILWKNFTQFEGEKENSSIQTAHREKIVNALLADFKNATYEQLTSRTLAPISITVKAVSKDPIKYYDYRSDLNRSSKVRSVVQFSVYPWCKNTINALKEAGYPNILEEEYSRFNKAVLWKTREEMLNNKASAVVSTSDPVEIRRIVESLNPEEHYSDSDTRYFIRLYYNVPIKRVEPDGIASTNYYFETSSSSYTPK